MSIEKTTARELIIKTLREKAGLKQDVFNNTQLQFKVLKQVMKEMADDMADKVIKNDDRIRVQYTNTGEYEARLEIGGDILIFQMHTNVFNFDSNNSLWKSSYLKENPNRAYTGVINVYNFLSDSFRYGRMNDAGYLIARMFINNENHFMVQGKRQLGFLYNDFINMSLTKEYMEKVIESTILYTLDFDLLVPPYEHVQEVTVHQVRAMNEAMEIKTAKRLGFAFQADSDGID